jgi:aspartate carbamoyltransferase regulatory subunit
MSDTSQLLVRRIRHGTVIDHIEAGKALLVLQALNVPSSKHGKKDIIKVENRFLQTSETNKLALIAPRATINIIRDYKLVEKRKVQLPDSIVAIFKCPNLKCITNSDEEIRSMIDVIDKEKVVLKCRYCARTLSTDELIF